MRLFEFDKSVDAERLGVEIAASGLESVYEYVHVKQITNVRIAMSDSITSPQEDILAEVVAKHIHPLTTAHPIQFWDHKWHHPPCEHDYKFVRAKIAAAVTSQGWSNLSQLEKMIAARWFVVDQDKRSEIYSLDEQVELGMAFHNNSVKARETRFKVASTEIYNRFNRQQQITIVSVVESNALPKLYVQYGIEGTLEGDVPGLFDYLEARNNTPYSGIGLAAQPFQPQGATMEQVVDSVMSILASGLYDYSQFSVL